MNGTRLSFAITGGDARSWVEAARVAEAYGVDVWIGSCDPDDGFTDSYKLAAAGFVAAVTADTRIGIFLAMDGTTSPLRLAEDLAVVDQASRGRVEVGLRVPLDGQPEWEERVRRMFDAWHEWPAQSGRTVAATPRPAQPWLPRVVAGGVEAAARLHAGRLILGGGADAGEREPAALSPRTILSLALAGGGEDGVQGWLGENPIEKVEWLRDEVDRARAHELLVQLPFVDGTRLTGDVRALGVVVAPSIRCSRHQAPFLVRDGFVWLTDKATLHSPPA